MRQALGDLHQQAVAQGVAARVVDLLEIVQVHIQQRPDLATAACGGQGQPQAVEQHAAVGQAREGIEVGQLVRALLRHPALGDVAGQRHEARAGAQVGAVLAGHGQLEPVGAPLQLQVELVARRVAILKRGLHGSQAAGRLAGRHDVLQPVAHKALGRQHRQLQARRAAMVDAALRVQLEQQVGYGVERAFQVIARAAQLGRHAACQCHGALPPGGQDPGEPAQQQAHEYPHHRHQVVAVVVMAQIECGQGRHHQSPAASADLQAPLDR